MSAAARPSRSKIIASIVLSLLVLGIGGASSAYLSGLKQPPALREPEPRRYNVEVFDVAAVNLQEIVTAFGTARADREAILAAQVAGEVVELHPRLRIGETVRPPHVIAAPTGESVHRGGDVLLVIDPRTYRERVVQVHNRLAEAKTELERLQQEETNLDRVLERLQADFEDAEREYKKVAELVKDKIATDSDVRRKQMELRQHDRLLVQSRNEKDLFPTRRAQLDRKIEALRNDLKLAELDVERTVIRTPFEGQLGTVSVELGQYVKPGDPLVSVVDNSMVEIPLAVTLEDYARLLPMVATDRRPAVRLAEHESASDRWHGELVRLSPKVDEQTRTVTVYVHVDNSRQASPLLPGTFVHARIEGPILSDVVVVPRESVLNGRGFVLEDGKAVQRTVRVSRALQTLALVDEGFAPGDQVILTNLDVLYEGAGVNPQRHCNLSDELAEDRVSAVRLLAE